jgi:predicted RNase H-like HicB family nuclease
MQKHYTAVIKKTDQWWISWVEEVPGVNPQGHRRQFRYIRP